MKKIILVLTIFASFAFFAKADFSLEQWRFQKEIVNTKSGLNEVQLDKEIFANSNKGLTDIRVVDGANQEVPYKLITAKKQDSQKQYNSRMLNSSAIAGKYSSAIMDLGGRGILTNSLTIKTNTENFQRNVMVYGSDDQSSWNTLKNNAYIYDYTDKKGSLKTQNTTVIFPDSVFRFIKVEISDAENSPVGINSVLLNQNTKTIAEEFETVASFQAEQDAINKSTILFVDLGQCGIPINKIKLSASGENFNRGVVVYTSNDKNSNNWKYVGQGYIFRYNTSKFVGENNEVVFNESAERYFKLVIYNHDNAPLVFSEVKTFATLRNLVFQSEAEKTYQIYYGNTNVSAPQYDLEKYFQYLDLSATQKVNLAEQKNNPNFVEAKKPLTEENRFLVPLLLGLACLILLFLVYKFLKK